MKYALSFLLMLCMALPAFARNPLDFSLHKLGADPTGPTLLVIGGIQGDEPGGFTAAGALVSNYRITKGNVWVVPNLNFPSIIGSSRGIHGDMNRKFAALSTSDPEYDTVEKIKAIITHKDVDLIMNLHDGSGFFRSTWQDSLHNPNRWGQSVIIDQAGIPSSKFSNLESMGTIAVQDVNRALLKASHKYHLKNTHTREGDKEMERTLTYFAINQGKPAFGVEASKSFRTPTRAYYHLRVLESFMRQMGIEFERDFPLTPEGLSTALEQNLTIAFHDGRILLDVQNARSALYYVPLQRDAERDFTTSHPLLTVVPRGKVYSVYYGNRNITQLSPQYFEHDKTLSHVAMHIDGTPYTARTGETVHAANTFEISPLQGYRVNVIGFTKQGESNESGITIRKQDMPKRFSLDKNGDAFRIELYKGDKFAGMVVVNFGLGANNGNLLSRQENPSATTEGR